MHNDPEGMIAESRLISIAHEIHVRLYPVYTFKMMNLSLEHDSSEPTDGTETLVTDIVTRLLRLGKFLNDQYKVKNICFKILHIKVISESKKHFSFKFRFNLKKKPLKIFTNNTLSFCQIRVILTILFSVIRSFLKVNRDHGVTTVSYIFSPFSNKKRF
jgi:hypothetical protein